MTIRAKIIATLIIAGACFLVGTFADDSVLSPFAVGSIAVVIGLWQLKNPYKKEMSIQQKRRKNRIDAIIILSFITIIVTLWILKQVGVLT
jgi:xanthine/uracil permease